MCFDRMANIKFDAKSDTKNDQLYRKTSKREFSVDLTHLKRKLQRRYKNKNNIVEKTKGCAQKKAARKVLSP